MPNPANMEAFLDFFKSDMIDNPPAPQSYLRILSDLTPEWEFFSKNSECSAKMHVVRSKVSNNTHERMAREKRRWIMEDENLDEFDMWLTATNTKEKGNEALKNEIRRTLLDRICYIREQIFCCEATYHQCSDNRVFNQPRQGRKSALPQGKGPVVIWENLNKEELEDINLALELQPGETAILALKDELTRLLGTVVSAAGLKRYLDQQPQPPAKISWSQGLNTAGQLIEGWQYDKLSKDSPLRRSLPPVY